MNNFKVDKVVTKLRPNECFVSVGQREETKGCDFVNVIGALIYTLLILGYPVLTPTPEASRPLAPFIFIPGDLQNCVFL